LVVSVDESNFSEKVAPMYGYSPKGTRCAPRLSKGTWKNRSLLLAIGSDGSKFHVLKDGSFKRKDFGEFVMSMPFPPGALILMDNCQIHKKLDDVFDAKGYVPFFLPAYSPMFQPVELAFSKIKGLFRNKWPWEDETVNDSIHACVEQESHSDILGHFRHAKRFIGIQ
jgi:hypothetical protein